MKIIRVTPAVTSAASSRKIVHLNDIVVSAMNQEIDQIPPGISIRKKLESTLRNAVANEPQLVQIILNLIANAVEAMEGRGFLRLTTRNVELTQEWLDGKPNAIPGSYVYVAVSDTGCGISPNLLEKIFEPFITTKFQGRGMGLASVFRNVEEHDRLVTVKSTVGKGSMFTVYLPSTDATVESHSGRNQIPSGTETILFIDNESRVLEEGKRIL